LEPKPQAPALYLCHQAAKIVALDFPGTRKNKVLEERKLPKRKSAETLRALLERGSAKLL